MMKSLLVLVGVTFAASAVSVGGKRPLSSDDTENGGIALLAAKAAADHYNKASNGLMHYKLHESPILPGATKQVVSGVKYHFNLALEETSCTKQQAAEKLDACVGTGKSKSVEFTVWARPWVSQSPYVVEVLGEAAL